jgi:hypothetical protein
MRPAPQLSIVKHLHGWKVASASQPSTAHFITNAPHWRCTCGSYMFGHGAPCRHIRAVKAMLAQEKEVVYQG